MSYSTDLISALQSEGNGLALTFERTTTATGRLTWTAPTAPLSYDGIVIVVSQSEINPSNYPTDGVKYTASANLLSPLDMIGSAQVVGAFYSDRTTAALDMAGLETDAVYFFAAFAVSNTRQYAIPGVRSYPESVIDESFAGDMDQSYAPPANPTIGQVYFDRSQSLVFVWDGTKWQTTSAHTVITGPVDPVTPFTGLPTGYPALGDFFYNTAQKMLKVWNNTSWINSETERGAPMYEKPGVGLSGRGTARLRMIEILKAQLGYPVVCVELTDFQFQIGVDNALQELRRRVDSAYTKEYFFLTTRKDQGLYYLNEPSVGTNRIVDVLKIHRLNLLGLVNFAPDNIYAQQFLNQFYAPGVQYDLVSIHLIHSMSEVYSHLFAGEIAFNWREASRELRFYRNFSTTEKVLVETTCEKSEEELLVDRWTQQWIQQWAEAELMFMLAHIRGKYANLPGPGGGLQLNADSLRAEAQRLQEDCVTQVNDMLVGQQGPDGWYVPFAIG